MGEWELAAGRYRKKGIGTNKKVTWEKRICKVVRNRRRIKCGGNELEKGGQRKLERTKILSPTSSTTVREKLIFLIHLSF